MANSTFLTRLWSGWEYQDWARNDTSPRNILLLSGLLAEHNYHWRLGLNWALISSLVVLPLPLPEVGLASQRLAVAFGPPLPTNGNERPEFSSCWQDGLVFAQGFWAGIKWYPEDALDGWMAHLDDKSNYTEVNVINRHRLFGPQNGIEINFVCMFCLKMMTFRLWI